MSLMIRTKYINPTDKHGARIKAQVGDDGASVTIPYRADLQHSEAHLEGVKALCDKLKLTDYPESEWRYWSFTRGYIWTNLGKQE